MILLSPLYDDLRKKGYREDKKHVVIEGIPTQFIPAYNSLIEEAVKEASEVKYKGTKTRVVQVEYLVAIMLQTGRSKDKSKLALVLEQSKLNRDKLNRIVARHGLAEKWAQARND